MVAIAAPAPAQGGASGGGAMYVAKPQVTKVACIRRCASGRRARPGSTLRITGRHLDSAAKVVFHGTYGRRDDAVSRVRAGSAARLHARVPMGAVSGPISVQATRTLRSARTRPISILPAPPPEPNPQLTPVPGPSDDGAPRLETGTSRAKAFSGGRAVTFSFRIGSASASVRVDLVRAADGSVVQSWTPSATPGQVQSVSWSGRIGRASAAPGRYSFRITAEGSNGRVARSAQPHDVQRDAFDLYDHIFPVRGRHNFGGSGAQFGAGRGNRSHQGHDVFARCGTPMVAARGGRVSYSGYHRAAGYYLVIDGAGSGLDYAYMHLAEPSPFRTGDRIYTGQRIGSVGQTGNARGCHLHFELWGAPGWYRGGRPFDPLPSLLAWDGWS